MPVIAKWGHGPVSIRSDGEAAIVDLKQDVRDRRVDQTTILEKSPPGDHQANGVGEQVIQTIAGLFRTNKSALEHKLGARLGSTLPVLKWLLEYGPTMQYLFKVGVDGKTPVERIRGRKCNLQLVPFARVQYIYIRFVAMKHHKFCVFAVNIYCTTNISRYVVIFVQFF